MKAFALSVLFFLLWSFSAGTCTTFLINKNGHLVFGRNYDWITASGMICTNQRGLQKHSWKTVGGEIANWTSSYGSISFNQYGKEFPTGGMNEKGLVVELMWLDGTVYPEADKRPALSCLQWIQYQLDCSASIADVINSDKKIRISGKRTSPLHFLIADAKGNAATIEFLDGKLVAHTGEQLPSPVLTNSKYEESVKWDKLIQRDDGSLPYINNSLKRFSTACNMVKTYQSTDIKTPITDYAFGILDAVKQGDYTRWSIVYDITARQVYFKSVDFQTIKTVPFAAFDFSCDKDTKAFDINQDKTGDISNSFSSLSAEENRRIFENSCRESAGQVKIDEATRNSMLTYANEMMLCENKRSTVSNK